MQVVDGRLFWTQFGHRCRSFERADRLAGNLTYLPSRIGGIMITSTTALTPQRKPELVGQTVVVIGGSSGIGFETARRARAEGAQVVLTGRNPGRLKQAALE